MATSNEVNNLLLDASLSNTLDEVNGGIDSVIEAFCQGHRGTLSAPAIGRQFGK